MSGANEDFEAVPAESISRNGKQQVLICYRWYGTLNRHVPAQSLRYKIGEIKWAIDSFRRMVNERCW